MAESSLTNRDIMQVVNRYIGVSGGYLGDFSYRTHADFYPEYCDLDIQPHEVEGTMRARYIEILGSLPPSDQAKMIRGTLERFPVGGPEAPSTRTQALHDQLETLAQTVDKGSSQVAGQLPTAITSAVVSRAIGDAENLIRASGATSGVDRVHTALHGFLKVVCDDEQIAYPPSPRMTQLFKLIRKQHPKFQNLGPRPTEVEKVLNSCANILDAMDPVRNNASVAHPNAVLLDEPEAVLVINVARTLMSYLDSKLSTSTS